MASFLSTRSLGRLVGRSHSSVAAWAFRDDWTFGPPPWMQTPTFVADVVEWMESTLGSPADVPVDKPGSLAVSTHELLMPDAPWYVGKLFSVEAMERLTLVDLIDFAAMLSAAHVDAAAEIVGHPLPDKAPAALWAALREQCHESDANIAMTIAMLNATTMKWIDAFCARVGIAPPLDAKPARRKRGRP